MTRRNPKAPRGRPPWRVDEDTSRRLARVRRRDTTPEQQLRALLRDLGIRVRSTERSLPGSPDVVSIKGGWAIQVNGCFWHRHAGCARATLPKRNRDLWTEKFAANVERDRRLARALRSQGFRLLVVWECQLEERPARVAAELRRFVAAAG